MAERGYSDVVRESQEVVELLLKAVLRQIGVEPPKTHDVGRLLKEHRHELPETARASLDEVAKVSRLLRKDRELSFYGAEDWIPTEEYHEDDARQARDQAKLVYDWTRAALQA